MRTLALASVAALAASLTLGALPASAATVRIGPNGVHVTEHHRPHYRHEHRRHCYMKTVRSWHHGHRVVKRVRVCR